MGWKPLRLLPCIQKPLAATSSHASLSTLPVFPLKNSPVSSYSSEFSFLFRPTSFRISAVLRLCFVSIWGHVALKTLLHWHSLMANAWLAAHSRCKVLCPRNNSITLKVEHSASLRHFFPVIWLLTSNRDVYCFETVNNIYCFQNSEHQFVISKSLKSSLFWRRFNHVE